VAAGHTAGAGGRAAGGGKLVFDPPEYRIAHGRAWRDIQISKALFILERLIGMVLIIMFAVGKTIILGGG